MALGTWPGHMPRTRGLSGLSARSSSADLAGVTIRQVQTGDRPTMKKTLSTVRRIVSSLALLVVVSFSLPDAAVAGGVGGYVEYSYGNLEIKSEYGWATQTQEYDNNRFGVGVVLDSNVARDELINVRATAGWVHTENSDGNADGGALDLAVGFGLWRTSAFRLWLAPGVRVGTDYYYNVDFVDRIVDLSVGGGASLGLNWHLNRRLSLSPSVSYRYMYVREFYSDEFEKVEQNGGEHLATVRLSVLFRSAGDAFKSSPPNRPPRARRTDSRRPARRRTRMPAR